MINKWFQFQSPARIYRPLIIGLLFSLVLVLLFGALTEDILRHEPLIRYDQLAEGWLLAHEPAGAAGLSNDVSVFGNAGVLTAVSILVAAWWAWRRNWLLAAGLFASVFGGGALDFVLKVLVQRPRPNFPNAPLHETDFGFPSAHATLSVLFFGFLAYALIQNIHSPKWRWLVGLCAGLIPLGVGISRLLLGVHYPTDVFAGWLAGATWLILCLSVLITLQKNQFRLTWRPRLAQMR